MDDFELVLTSYEDCDYFVAEIWYQNNLIAVVKDNNEIHLFDENDNKTIITSDLFKAAIDLATEKLKGV